MVTDPDLITRMRAATPDLAELAALSAVARAGTDGLPSVRAARRAGWDRSVLRSSLARARRRHTVARAAGYQSWAAAVRGTSHLSAATAAVLLGVGASTVKRWRQHYR